MSSALLNVAIFVAAQLWPAAWLENAANGIIDAEYKITDNCDFDLVGFGADPPGLSRETAFELLETLLIENRESIDAESVFAAVPEATQGETLTIEQYNAVVRAADTLGPWSSTRMIKVDGKLLVCEFDPEGRLIGAAFYGEVGDVRPLSGLPLSNFQVRFLTEE